MSLCSLLLRLLYSPGCRLLFSPLVFGLVARVSDSEAEASHNNLEFALKFYSQLKQSDGNIAFSPFSIEQALGLTLLGAKGDTAAELSQALSFSEPNGDPRLAEATKILKQAADKEEFTIRLANAIWIEKTYQFLRSFTDAASDTFEATLERADFIHGASSVRDEINEWVADITKDMIPDLLPNGVVTSNTRIVLVNAIYFKARWASPFKKVASEEGEFSTTLGVQSSAMFMSQQRHYRYAENEELQLLELPYQGDSASMLLLLPRKSDGLGLLEASLSTSQIDSLLKSAIVEEVRVRLPKFKVSFGQSLVNVFKKLGVRKAFITLGADFSGMDGTKLLNISEIIHRAVVETDERGTEAAAATAVVGGKALARNTEKPKLFNADHPFLFFIREKTKGNVLFMGRVSNPGSGAGE